MMVSEVCMINWLIYLRKLRTSLEDWTYGLDLKCGSVLILLEKEKND